jgi:hypothetical protein
MTKNTKSYSARLFRFTWISILVIIAIILFLFLSIQYLPGKLYSESSGLSASSLDIHFSYVYKLIYLSDIGISKEYGIISYSENKVILRRIYSESNPPNIYDTLSIVKWGKRTYLIDPSEIHSFCQHINNGWEPRNQSRGGFLLAENDWNISVGGKPDLPEEYINMISDSITVRKPNPFYGYK